MINKLDVAATTTQAGFYDDLEAELLYGRRTWTTTYLVSHSNEPDSGFAYVIEPTTGEIMVKFRDR